MHKNETNKQQIMHVAKHLFANENPAIIALWEDIDRKWSQFEDWEELKEYSASLTAIHYLNKSIQYHYKTTDIDKMLAIIQSYEHSIKQILQSFVDWDLNTCNRKDDLIEDLLSRDASDIGTSLVYHRLREAISMQKFEKEDDVPTYKLLDNRDKKVTHVAQIKTEMEKDMVIKNGENGQWEELMARAITNMDDYTADTFDVISILWMKSATSKKDSIHFSHEDVLRFRQMQKKKAGNGSESYRKKDREEVMRRLAALASIWIHESGETVDETGNFDLSKACRLFHIDNVTFATDRKTKEPIGIYECDIRPAEILSNYLHGSAKQIGFLSLQALRYNPNKHKYHKRLTRYLSWQWKMRTPKDKPFNIGGSSGLLNAMSLEVNAERPQRTVDTFESILDKLESDHVIGSWEYVGGIDRNQMRGRGWLEHYWLKLQVKIQLPQNIKELYALSEPKGHALDYSTIQTLVKSLPNEDIPTVEVTPVEITPVQLDISPEYVMKIRKERGLNLSQAAKEIGISHTTLSRYEKKQIKRPNKANDEKIRLWLYGK